MKEKTVFGRRLPLFFDLTAEGSLHQGSFIINRKGGEFELLAALGDLFGCPDIGCLRKAGQTGGMRVSPRPRISSNGLFAAPALYLIPG
jgi:hypothetical protein